MPSVHLHLTETRRIFRHRPSPMLLSDPRTLQHKYKVFWRVGLGNYALYMRIPLQITLNCNTQQLECLYHWQWWRCLQLSRRTWSRGGGHAPAWWNIFLNGLTVMWSLFARACRHSVHCQLSFGRIYTSLSIRCHCQRDFIHEFPPVRVVGSDIINHD